MERNVTELRLLGAAIAELRRLAGTTPDAETARSVSMVGELLATLLPAEMPPPDATAQGLTVERARAALQEAGLLTGGGDVAVERAAIGYSKDTFIVTLTTPGAPAKRLVIRRDVPAGPARTTVAHEYPLLVHLHDLGFHVAQPIYLAEKPGALGQPYMISEARRGGPVSVADGLDSSTQKRIVETLGAELGRLHALNHDELRLWPPGSGDDPAGALLGYIEHWRALWQEAYVPGLPAIDAAFDWLGANVPADLERLAIVHSDFGLHNVLADGGEVTAILDWEFAHLGEPAEDLEYVRAGIEPLGAWEHFLSSYLSAGGPEPVPGRARFYRVWRSQRNAVCCALGLQAFQSGANPDLRMAYIGRVLLPIFAGLVAGELDSPGTEET